MNAYIEILRPWNAIMAVIAVILVAIINGNFSTDIFLACAVVFIVTGAGNSINDYFDHKIDAINKPKRPIPSGRIPLKTAGMYSIFLFILGISIAFIINFLLGVIALLSSFLMVYYAYDLKRRCIIGNLSISFLTGLCFVFGGIAAGEIINSIYLGFYAFLMTMAREIVKDMEDVEGDKEEGATTFPIIYGNRKASIFAAFFMIISSITSPVLYYLGLFNIFYFIILSIAIIIFLISAKSILKDYSVLNAKKISKRIKIGMGIVFLAFALGSNYITNFFFKLML
ncbi:MAG: UbiA family prenyltransferase [Methanobacteriaceae archaeon]|nr:UbiA family prenyltransferase [Methanobacteriaceae archaeon]